MTLVKTISIGVVGGLAGAVLSMAIINLGAYLLK